MRSAGNFHPEWGYLAPAPSFMRTARVALVATAIGATAGAVVVVSLVVRPGANDDNGSIAAHALVSAAPLVTAPVVSALPASKAPSALAQAPAPQKTTAVSASAQPQAPSPVPVPDNLASAGKPSPALAPPVVAPASVASVGDIPAAADATPTSPDSIMAPEASPAKKDALKKRRVSSAEAFRRWHAENNAKKRPRDASAFGPLIRLFSFRGSSSYDN